MSWAIFAGLAAVIVFAVRGAAKEAVPGASGSGAGGPAPATTLQQAQMLGTLPADSLAAGHSGEVNIIQSATATVAIATALVGGVNQPAGGTMVGTGNTVDTYKPPPFDLTQGKGGGKAPLVPGTPAPAANPSLLFSPLTNGVGKVGVQTNATGPAPQIAKPPAAAAELQLFKTPPAYKLLQPMVIETAALSQVPGTAILRPMGDRTPAAAPPPNTVSVAQVVSGAKGSRLGFL